MNRNALRRATSVTFAPASLSNTAKSMADAPAPMTVTSSPRNRPIFLCAELCVTDSCDTFADRRRQNLKMAAAEREHHAVSRRVPAIGEA